MSHQEESSIRQRADEVEPNALRIDTDRAEQIIEALNTDLANAYVLYHQLKKHHWTVEGAEFLELHVFLEEAYEHVEVGADLIAERAQALGGVPVSGMEALSDRATVEHEGEDVYDVRTSLESDLAIYGDIIEDLRDHIELADNLGDYTTKEILQHDVLKKVEEDAHHIEHYLEDDTLVLEEATH
ncbi:DNA starvation/stationary phase protection protein DpsA [Halomarina salina]|uniref:DNA starvation/stationary phase protection protein DpsA n=1 Tax=Halomarina salina TaxID=1872699 RepID=A0ABD5RGZ1_9EURY|nr:DNA starvation/stationary phase protection protein DpsA [Halomarina salina]